MSMMIAGYLATFFVFVGVDMVWLGYVAHGFYRSQIGHLLGSQVNLSAAAVFYLLYTLGIMVMVVQPAAGQVVRGFGQGLMFGLFCYATYDLTNMATLKNWTWSISIVDMAWGSFLTGIAAAAGTYVAGKF
jgi:uncharacterized membrane protein